MSHKTNPPGLVDEDCVERFRVRVTVGTFVGVTTCLLFAAMLMLTYWLPNQRGASLAGGPGGGAGGHGAGRAVGDGMSSDVDADGDSDRKVAGETDASIDTSAGDTGIDSGVAANAQESGSADLKTPQDHATVVKGTGAVVAARSLPKRSFMVPALDQLRLDPADDDGLIHVAVAGSPGMFEGRDAEQRKKLAEAEGGNEASESAVERGLKWLANHQDKDGHWSLHEFHTTGECNGQCSMLGTRSDAAATGFGLLPFLGAGYTHRSGGYKETVKTGLDWLLEDQTKEGTFRHCEGGTLYAHGIAAIALCEAWAMTKDPRLKRPAQRTIDYIVKAQHSAGGWRYGPGQPGDTSVSGWQVIALRSAQQGGLRFPKDVMTKVSAYLDSAQTDKQGSGYAYMPHGARGSDAMVAEGLLCRIYSTWNSKRPGLTAGVHYLLSRPPRPRGELYYWYYATQVMHHFGGEPWEEWNPVMRDLLIDSQSTEGHEFGSWAPQGGHDSRGGRVYATSLSLLTLEIYYRHKRMY